MMGGVRGVGSRVRGAGGLISKRILREHKCYHLLPHFPPFPLSLPSTSSLLPLLSPRYWKKTKVVDFQKRKCGVQCCSISPDETSTSCLGILMATSS